MSHKFCTVSNVYRGRTLSCSLAGMAADINEEFHALCRKMAEETDPEKLELLKQQLRLLCESGAEPQEETPGGVTTRLLRRKSQ